MRVALLSSVESLSGHERLPRAFSRIGGRSVVERQLDFALSMECELVACLSDSLHPELIDLQHSAEKSGVRFQVIRDVRPLSGLVKAADELLVISDGLAFNETLAAEKLAGGKIVLTLPAETAVPTGFERLDRDLAWAGIMLVNGTLVERLVEMPSDIDPQSSLLRLALQSGTKTGKLSDAVLSDNDWMIVQDTAKINAFEESWLGNAAEPASFAAPVSAGADLAAMAVLRRHTNPAKAARAVGGLGYALMAIAALCGYFGYFVAGFFIAALAAFSERFSLTTSAILSEGRGRSKGGQILAKLPPVVLDLLLVGLVLFSASVFARIPALFAVGVLIGLLRLAAVQNGFPQPRKLQQLLEDRGVLALVLGLGLSLGKLIIGIQIVGALLLAMILFQTYSARITRA